MLLRCILGLMCLAVSSCAGKVLPAPTISHALRPTVAEDIATITALEDGWSQAFLKKDMAFLEQIVAPEFEVHGWRGGRYGFTGRDRWMQTTREWTFVEHPSKVLHVRVYGDTAIATVQGKLVTERNGRSARNNEWIVTDTWLRRDGRWQVVFRYADTLPGTCKVGCGGQAE